MLLCDKSSKKNKCLKHLTKSAGVLFVYFFLFLFIYVLIYLFVHTANPMRIIAERQYSQIHTCICQSEETELRIVTEHTCNV